LNYTRWPTQILCRFLRVGKFATRTRRSSNALACGERPRKLGPRRGRPDRTALPLEPMGWQGP